MCVCMCVCVDIKLNDLLCAGVRVIEFTCACVCECVSGRACARERQCVNAGMRENVSGMRAAGMDVCEETSGCWPIGFVILE